MARHLMPEKVRIVNLLKQWKPAYLNANGTPTTPDVATEMSVPGFGRTKISQVKNVSIAKGLEFNAEELTVTFGAVTTGALFNIDFKLETTNREFRLSRPEYEFGIKELVTFVTEDGDTAAQVGAKFTQAVNITGGYERQKLLTATDNTDGTVTLSINLEGGYNTSMRGTFFDLAKTEVRDAEDNVINGATADPTISFAKTMPGQKGIGYGSDIEFKEKFQGRNLVPYFFDNQEVPEEGSYYTAIYWEFDVNRPDPLGDPLLSNSRRHLVYIKEGVAALDAVVDTMVEFFLTSPSTRATSLVAEGVRVGFNDAEVVTVSASPAAGGFDSDTVIAFAEKGALTGTDPKYVVVESVAKIDDVSAASLVTKLQENA